MLKQHCCAKHDSIQQLTTEPSIVLARMLQALSNPYCQSTYMCLYMCA